MSQRWKDSIVYLFIVVVKREQKDNSQNCGRILISVIFYAITR